MMNRGISFLFGVLVLVHVSPPQTVDAKNAKKEASFPKFVPEGDDVFNDDDPFVEDTQTIQKMKDTKKDTKKGKDDKKQSKKSSDCSFEPSGDIRATPDEVVTGPAASEGEGDFHFEFSSGFRAMDYDITIFDQSSISAADLYCASEGNEADTPVVSLGFRDREQTFYSQVKNGDIEETTCAEDGSVINNVGKWYSMDSMSHHWSDWVVHSHYHPFFGGHSLIV
jgi:hypothetical protein